MAEAMDLKSMKRKDLQELCKKHGIPANSTSLAMIESLSSLFQTQKVVKRKGCLKGSRGSSSEGLGIGGSKKVTFVLEEEDEEVGDLGFVGNRGVKNSRRRSTVRGKRLRDANVEEVGQKKLKKQTKDGEVVTEIIRRSTRSSSNGEVAKKEKPLKRRKPSEIVTEPPRRATRRSSNLLEEPSDDEKVKMHEPAKQAKTRASEVVTEPVRRLTSSSANLKGDEVIVPAAGKFGNGGEAVRKGKSQKQTKKHVPEQGDLAVFVSDSEAVVAPAKRSTHSSSKLLGDESAPLAAEKPQKQAKKHVSRRADSVISVSDSEAVTRSVKRLTRRPSIFLKDEGYAVAVVKPQQQAKKHVSGRGGSTVSLSDSEAVISPMRRSTCSSSKLLEGASSLTAVGKMNDDFDAVRKVKSGKQAKKGSASKASLLASEAINKPTRRSRSVSMHKLLEGGTSSRQRGKSEVDSLLMKKDCYRKKIFEVLISAISTITIVDTAHFLAMSEEDATNYALKHGWTLDPSSNMLTVKKPKVVIEQKVDFSKLKRLTECLPPGALIFSPVNSYRLFLL